MVSGHKCILNDLPEKEHILNKQLSNSISPILSNNGTRFMKENSLQYVLYQEIRKSCTLCRTKKK